MTNGTNTLSPIKLNYLLHIDRHSESRHFDDDSLFRGRDRRVD